MKAFKLLVSSAFLCLTQLAFSQSLNPADQVKQWLETNEGVEQGLENQQINFTGISIVKATKIWVINRYADLQRTDVTVSLAAFRESPIGYHLAFKQKFKGVEIYGTDIKVNMDKEGNVLTINKKIVNTASWSLPELKTVKPTKEESLERLIVFDGISPESAWRSETFHQASNSYLELIELDNGTIIANDLASYHRERKLPDSLVYLYVFNPDPLTETKNVYGGPYANHHDSDIAELNAARVVKPLRLKYLSDSIWAENQFVKFNGGSNKNFTVAYALNDTIDIGRGDDFFEQINAIYHITTIQQNIKRLGFDTLAGYKIPVNPRALLDDNSRFVRKSASGGKGELEFGYSDDSYLHIDDAEDADVIAHEYGHAISYSANYNALSTTERKSLEEGLCDYMACSYSHKTNEYDWENLFNWDGHNEYWEGRSCVTMRHYPEDYNDPKAKIYDKGEIWTGCLMEIWGELGPDITDRILFESMFFFAESMKFTDVATYLLKADDMLYAGSHRDVMCTSFKKYGLVKICGNSVDELDVAQRFTLDHNKFSTEGIVQCNFSEATTAFIQVIDVNGRVIYSESVKNANNCSLATGISAPGVYIINIRFNGLAPVTAKAIRF